MLLISVLRKLRQENSEFVASLGYVEKPCLKEAKVKRSEESWMWTVLSNVVPALLHFWLIGASSEPSGQSTSPSHSHRAFTRQRPSAHWNSPVPHCRYPRKEEASVLQVSIIEIHQRSTLSGHSPFNQPGGSPDLCEKYFSFLSITALRNACCVRAGIKVK